MRTRVLAVAAILLGLLAPAARAQGLTGTIEGTVKGSDGQPVPGATVIVRRLDTGTRLTATTGPTGAFHFPFVTPARYEVGVDATGFHPETRPPFELSVGNIIDVDVVLTVATSVEVVVQSEAPVIPIEPSIGQVTTSTEMARLPVANRNYLSLAVLTPGVAPTSAGANPFDISGARADHVNFAVDGFSNVNRRGNDAVLTPPLEALQEFKVSTTPAADQPSRLEAGAVSVALKSGADTLTGSAYEFYRTGALEGSNAFTPADRDLRRHDAGATLGGPIVAHRAFFFAAAQVLSLRDLGQQFARVPTASERSGVFATPIRDPRTRALFPANTIPAARIDPIAAAYLSLMPLANQDGVLNYAAAARTSTTEYQPLVKIDDEVSSRTHVSAVYMGDVTNADDPFRAGPVPAFGSTRRLRNHLGGVTQRWIAGSNVVLENRISVAHQSFDEDAAAAIAGAPVIAGVDASVGPPSVVIAGLPSIGHATFLPDRWTDREITVSSTMSWSHRQHMVRAGGQFQHSGLENLFASFAGGQLAFLGTFTGNAFADFLLGLPAQTTRQVGTNLSHLSSNFVGLFAQDEWHLRPRTTLFVGARYDVQMPPVERDGHWTNFIPSMGTTVAAGGPLGRSVLATDWNNIAPNVSIAQQVGTDERVVLHAGYAAAFSSDLLFTQYQLLGATAYPFTRLESYTATGAGALTLANPFPSTLTASAPGVLSPNGWDYSNPTPHEHVWNAGVTVGVTNRDTLGVTYIGMRGRDQTVTVNINQPQRTSTGPIVPFPGYGRILYQTFSGSSQYDAIEGSVSRRYSAGLAYRTSVTWSRAYDDASFGSPARLPQDPRDIAAEWGPSEFDRRWTWTGDATWDIPFGHRRAAARLLGGWQVSGVVVAASGRPFTPIVASANQQAGFAIRPDRVGDPTVAAPSAARWFNPAAFSPVAPNEFRMGTAGRDSLRGPGEMQIDVSLARPLVSGARSVQLRIDAFNVTNRVNLGQPDPRIDQPTAGIIASAGPPRQIQLGLRVLF